MSGRNSNLTATEMRSFWVVVLGLVEAHPERVQAWVDEHAEPSTRRRRARAVERVKARIEKHTQAPKDGV